MTAAIVLAVAVVLVGACSTKQPPLPGWLDGHPNLALVHLTDGGPNNAIAQADLSNGSIGGRIRLGRDAVVTASPDVTQLYSSEHTAGEATVSILATATGRKDTILRASDRYRFGPVAADLDGNLYVIRQGGHADPPVPVYKLIAYDQTKRRVVGEPADPTCDPGGFFTAGPPGIVTRCYEPPTVRVLRVRDGEVRVLHDFLKPPHSGAWAWSADRRELWTLDPVQNEPAHIAIRLDPVTGDRRMHRIDRPMPVSGGIAVSTDGSRMYVGVGPTISRDIDRRAPGQHGPRRSSADQIHILDTSDMSVVNQYTLDHPLLSFVLVGDKLVGTTYGRGRSTQRLRDHQASEQMRAAGSAEAFEAVRTR